jgi:antitoxin (DNA-binding transcriptional repressor) of toxin-antitoxin stability system
MEFNVGDAKKKLPEPIKAVEDGELVTLCRRAVPLSTSGLTKEPTRKKRIPGTLRGKIEILDPNSWKPIANADAE